jgi:hypothetical protein
MRCIRLMATTNYERLLVMKQNLFKLWMEYFRSLPLRHFQRLIPLFLVMCMATPSVAAVIDVTTYGAIPNDSVDDSLAIQKAIDAAPANSTIYFPQGTYRLCPWLWWKFDSSVSEPENFSFTIAL